MTDRRKSQILRSMNLLLLMGMAECLLHCYAADIVRKPLIKKNPTQWDFKASPEQITDCIRLHEKDFLKSLEKNRSISYGYLSISDSSISRDGLTLKANQPIVDSPIYYGDDNRLPFISDFQISFLKNSNAVTKVKIECKQPQVISGYQFTMGHGWRKHFYEKVDCTTIEEYLILLGIGECTKTMDMPEPILPDK